MAMAIAIALFVGISAGTIMALNVKRTADRVLSLASLLFYSVPAFWIGLIFIIVFSVKLGWLPAGGIKTIGVPSRGVGWILDRATYAVLPATSLALYYVAIYARLTRSSILDVIGQDH